MTTQILDTFTDPDGTSLFAHTPDVDLVGAGWQLVHPTSGPGSDFEIQSNQLEVPVNPNPNLQPSMALIDSGVSDLHIRGRFVSAFSTVSQIFFRAQDHDNYLSFELEREPIGSIILRKKVNGVASIITSVSTGDFGAGTVEFEIIAEGSSLTVRDLTNDNELTATETDLETNTNVGFGDQASSGLWNVDCFLVRSITEAEDVQVEAVLVQQPAAIGTQDIVAPELGTTVPKGVLLFWSAAGVPGSGVGPDGNHYDDAAFGMGASDGLVEWATTVHQGDGGPPTLVSRGQTTAEIVRLLDPSGVTLAVVAAAAFDCFIAGGVRIDWTSVHSLQFSLIAVFFTGDNDCEVKCGVHPEDRSVANPIFIGFEPDFVLTSTIDDGNDPTADRLGLGSWGMQDFADPDRLASQARAWATSAVESSSHLARFNDASVSFIGVSTVGTLWSYADAPPDEMNLELVSGFDSSELLVYMAVRCGGVQVKVGNIISPQAAGLWKVDDPNFEPQFVMLMLGNQPSFAAVSDADDQVMGVGIMTDSFQASQSANIENNQDTAPASNQSYLDDEAVVALTGFDPTDQLYLGEWLAFHSQGWSLAMETIESPAVEEQWGYLAIEASTSQVPAAAVDDGCTPNPWTTDEAEEVTDE